MLGQSVTVFSLILLIYMYSNKATVALSVALKCYYNEKIVYPILILSKSIFEMRQNSILHFSIPHLVPEIFS